MDIFVKIVIVLILLGFVYLLFQTRSLPKKTNDTKHKKEDIIKNYKKRLKSELVIFKNNPQKLQKYKIVLLKEISNELSRNIYFDKSEIKAIIQELAAVEIK